MTTNECVTLYHYDEESEAFTRYFFPRASVHRAVLAAVAESGLVMDSVVKIRIPTDAAAGTAGLNNAVALSGAVGLNGAVALNSAAGLSNTVALDSAAGLCDAVGLIDVGDYVFIGESESERPDRARCCKVLGFSQNLRGANPHIRIEAK